MKRFLQIDSIQKAATTVASATALIVGAAIVAPALALEQENAATTVEQKRTTSLGGDGDLTTQTLEQMVVADDGRVGERFGASVAIADGTAVVGAPNADIAGVNNGAVYVFMRTGNTWVQTSKLIASDARAYDFLGVSVAIDGDVIVAGAPGADFRGNVRYSDDAGAVYTFERTGSGTRTETAKFTTSAPRERLAWLGTSVAIDGDVVVAGAPSTGPTGGWQTVRGGNGAVHTFPSGAAGNRTETATLLASDAFEGQELGTSVAIDGDVIVAGAPATSSAVDNGSAYTFARNGGNRTQTAKLTVASAHGWDRLGTSVAIDRDEIVVGAPWAEDEAAGAQSGAAYTFAATGPGNRTDTGILWPMDSRRGDEFGSSVAIGGDTIMVGARGYDVGSNENQGVFATYYRGGGNQSDNWKYTASDGASEDRFGASVARDAAAMISGAPFDDVGANGDQGSATIFFAMDPDAPPPPPASPTPAPDPSPTEPSEPVDSSISLDVAKTAEKIKASGEVEPSHPDLLVSVVLLKRVGEDFVKVTTKEVPLDEFSSYIARFDRPKAERCRVKARFKGDADHLASSAHRTFDC